MRRDAGNDKGGACEREAIRAGRLLTVTRQDVKVAPSRQDRPWKWARNFGKEHLVASAYRFSFGPWNIHEGEDRDIE